MNGDLKRKCQVYILLGQFHICNRIVLMRFIMQYVHHHQVPSHLASSKMLLRNPRSKHHVSTYELTPLHASKIRCHQSSLAGFSCPFFRTSFQLSPRASNCLVFSVFTICFKLSIFSGCHNMNYLVFLVVTISFRLSRFSSC